MDGIDIQSQKTNEQLDQDDDKEYAHFLNCWDNDNDFQNEDQNLLYQRQRLDHESVLDFALKKQKQASCKKTEYKANEKSFDNIEVRKNKLKMISENNDSIALNKSQVSMHDNYQNGLDDSITNAPLNFSVADDDENSQMMCDIIADSVYHEITAQRPVENIQPGVQCKN